jgi:putative ABC transport system permease protein
MGFSMNIFLQDIRYSLRILLKNRGVTLIQVLTLALGIGVNTAIFSIVNAILIESLPFPQPSNLVAIFQTMPQQNLYDAGTSYPNLVDWKSESKELEEIAALRNHIFTLTGSGDPTYLVGASVTSNLFAALKVGPVIGRTLTAADDELNAPPVAVIGEELWRNRFETSPSILGRNVNLDNKSFTIVGVMPRIFRFPYGTTIPQVWIPLSHEDIFRDMMARRKGHYLQIIGRLKPGISLQQAQSGLAVIEGRLGQRYPEANGGWGVRLEPLQNRIVGNVRTPLMLLWAAVGFVLVIAGLNMANLLLGQATTRVKEFVVRMALGGTRSRLVRQLLTECLLLGVTGGTLGVVFAYVCVTFASTHLPSEIPRVHEIRMDGLVLLFTALLSIAVSIVIGLVPALSFSAVHFQTALQEGGRSSSIGKSRLRMRNFLVTSEIIISMVLLVAAGLVLRSFQRLQSVDLGFEPRNVVIANLSLSRDHYNSPQQWASFYDQVIQNLNAVAGVPEAAVAIPVPPFGAGFNFRFTIQGRPPEREGQDLTASYSAVSADYFKLLQIPLERGRLFSPGDRPDTMKVCVISDKFARTYFPNEDPIGKQLVFGYLTEEPRTVVGVVRDVKQVGVAAPFTPQMYVPYMQNPWSSMEVLVRTSSAPEMFLSVLTRKVHEIDPQLPVADIAPLTEAISESIAQPRFRTMFFGLFGLIALVLASVGVYGVISYFVTQRTREIGVRMALGAQQKDVLKLILWQGFRLALAGVAIGLPLALALGRTMGSLLYGISSMDTLTFCSAGGLLLLVALIASYVPARRAVSIDPIAALRQE